MLTCGAYAMLRSTVGAAGSSTSRRGAGGGHAPPAPSDRSATPGPGGPGGDPPDGGPGAHVEGVGKPPPRRVHAAVDLEEAPGGERTQPGADQRARHGLETDPECS